MARKKKTEKVKRFNLRMLDSTIEKIKEDCFLWALRHVGDVAEVYRNDIGNTEGMEGLDDRLKDILEPLLCIGAIIDASTGDNEGSIIKALTSLAKDMGQGRDNQEALNGSIPAVVNLMKGVTDGVEEQFISADDLFSKFQTDEDLNFIHTKRGLAFFLAKLNLHRAPPRWVKSSTVRGYSITKKWIDDLGDRYA